MAIVTPATLTITDAQGLVLPKMVADPLLTALKNVNHEWQYYRPPLVDVCPNAAPLATRTITVVVPISPSVDGLRYTFRTEVVTSAATNVTVSVDYTTAWTGLAASGTPTAWVNIFANASATPAGARYAQTDANQVIPATAVALRYQVSVAAGNFTLHHLLAMPTPAAPTAGIQASGYMPFDDGILSGVVNAPIHTEFINRCQRSSRALLRDRKQMCLSFAQEEAQANVRAPLINYLTGLALPPFPPAYFAGQGKTVKIRVSGLVSISGGAGVGVVTLGQVPSTPSPDFIPQSISFDGTQAGTLTTQNLTLYLEGPQDKRCAQLVAKVKTTAGDRTYLHALTALWQPGET